MKKVLIVSPHFAPTNSPDMQRVRLALPYLRKCGWEPIVLAIAPEYIESGVMDPLLESTYPADIRIVRVRGVAPRLTRRLGFGGLWLRCGRALRAAGERLLETERFDLVFFSTTQFDAFALGPRWKRMFGVPYVLDYQDPWVNDYYARTGTKPPGGRLKFAFAQWRARRQEPRVLRGAAGVIAVSDAYSRTLAARYPWFRAEQVRLLPFGAAERDLALARSHHPASPLVPFGDGCFHQVYTGRCGPDMTVALTILFRAFKLFQQRQPDQAARMRFHFIGTGYAPPPYGREWVMPLAHAEGVADRVHEHCYRVPYFDALSCLVQADALLAVGSNDPTYSASKIFPYILARRPLLIVFNRQSPVLAFAEQTGSGVRYGFTGPEDIERIAAEICVTWFEQGAMHRPHDADLAAFAPFTAEAMSRALAACFDEAGRIP